MSETWRYVDCGAVDAFENNAQMTVLARSATDAAQPILQTSAWGATHLNVGWFDDVDSTLDVAACERLGIQVIRRPFAGGGTAFYDRGCAVMWGVMFPKPGDHDDLDAEIAAFQPIVLDVLDRLGLGDVRFEGSAALGGAHVSDDDDLGRRIASVFEAPDVHQADTTTGVTTDDLLAALRKAVDNAKEAPA